MRMNAMTRPVPSIDTVLPARNRRVAGDIRIVGIAADADDPNRQPSRVVSSCCGTIRWADRPGVGDAYTAAPGNWAPASRPVRAPGGVYTGRRYDVVRKEGAQDGDSRSSLTGAGRGWRGVPGAGRVPPAGAAGALLPDARILPGRRGRRPGDDAGPLARHRRGCGRGSAPRPPAWTTSPPPRRTPPPR